MNFAVCILAKDEAGTIGQFLQSLSQQTLLREGSFATTVFIAANGSADGTAQVAQAAALQWLSPIGIESRVFDFAEPGKSRSWNLLVHREMAEVFDLVAFIDADIEFIGNDVLENAARAMTDNPALSAYTGYPVKHIATSERKGALDRLSLVTSSLTRYVDRINGSLYLLRGTALVDLWLPDETPGDDGFINAMVDTAGFTRAPVPGAIVQSASPTHYFEAHQPWQFFVHERRMIVGTMINSWIFDHLWSLGLTRPAGPLIDRWNRENPRWVADIVAERVNGRRWVIPRKLMTRRMRAAEGGGLFARIVRFPVLLAATVLTVPPAVLANRALRRRGAATLW